MTSLASRIQTPLWAHGQYANENNELLELFRSLAPGDVIQVGSIKSPLRISEVEDGIISVERANQLRKQNELRIGDGRKYNLYFHREKSKVGIGEMAVLYRADGSVSTYTVEDIGRLSKNASRWEIEWENTERIVKPLGNDADRPSIDPTIEELKERPPSLNFSEVNRQMHEVQRGANVEDMDKLTEEYEFETRVEEVTNLNPASRSSIPYGTVLFKRTTERNERQVVPMDKVIHVRQIDESDA